MRVPYDFGDLKRDPNLENCPCTIRQDFGMFHTSPVWAEEDTFKAREGHG